MATDVTYLCADMCQQQGIMNDTKSAARKTRDLLGGGGGGGDCDLDSLKELDLDLHVPSGYERRLDLKEQDESHDLLISKPFGAKPSYASFIQDSSICEKDDGKEKERFSLILHRSISLISSTPGDKRIENDTCSYEILGSGMILMKSYVTLSDQVEIVKTCEELGLGPGNFKQPDYQNGGKLRLHMMCLGRNWDPQTKYDSKGNGSEAPPMIPDKLTSLVKMAIKDSQALLKSESEDEFPCMSPDICIVNFYTTAGRLGLHQDRDESLDSLSRGLPVVSISIGDSAEFLYGKKREVKKAGKVVLESGDVLIFGGRSRLVYHGVKTIIPDSAPLPLLKQTMLRPGRLNLTFRQF